MIMIIIIKQESMHRKLISRKGHIRQKTKVELSARRELRKSEKVLIQRIARIMKQVNKSLYRLE